MKYKSFLVIFLNTQNIHLIKDVGMIPFHLQKVFNYKSYIATYDNGNYNYLDTYVKGLEILFIKRKFKSDSLNVALFLIKNFKRFDVLMCFHYYFPSVLYLLIFKTLTLGKGQTYLKLDANTEIIKSFSKRSLKSVIFRFFLKTLNLISVETKKLFHFLKKNGLPDILYLPNGYFETNVVSTSDIMSKKENVIISVARMGDPNKNVQMLVEAFIMSESLHNNWKLKLIGYVESTFENYIKTIFNNNPKLRHNIILTGNIEDREQLNEEYMKAKVFVLTSYSESFGFVLIEALKNGCFIISTDVLAANDITDNQKYGKIVLQNDIKQLSQVLVESCNHEDIFVETSPKSIDFAKEQFSWVKICTTLNDYIRKSN